MRLGFLINLEFCADHRGCTIACKREKNTPVGVRYIETFTARDDSFPNNNTYFIPIMCQHCENPSCVPSCSKSVFTKTPLGPVIVGDTAVCEQCEEKPCISACPYHAIKLLPDSGRVGKCDMCVDKLMQKQAPACAPNCYCMAIVPGDIDDPQSPYNQMKAKLEAPLKAAGVPCEVAFHKLRPELENNPSVTYFLARKPWRDMNDLYSPAWTDTIQ